MTNKSFNRNWITRIVQLLFVPIFILGIRFYQKRMSHLKKYQCAHSHRQGGLSCSAHAINSLENDDFITAIRKILKRRKDCHATARVHGFSYRKLYIKSGIAVVALSALTGCGGSGDSDKSLKPINIDIQSGVTSISHEDLNNILETESTNNDETIFYTNSNAELATKTEGEIVYIPPSNDLDTGIFTKIKGITESNGQIKITTEPPKLGEAMSSYKSFNEGSEPRIIGVIAPPNSILSNGTQKEVLQQGLTEITPEIDLSKKEIKLNIEITARVPKAKYNGFQEIERYKRYCAYPKNYADDHEGVSYARALEYTEKLCEDIAKITGTVEFKLGEKVDTLDLDDNDGGNLKINESVDNQEILIKGNKQKLEFTVVKSDRNVSISQLEEFKDLYAESLFKDYERAELKNRFGHVALTGLSSKDKTGKIPIGGLMYTAGLGVSSFDINGKTIPAGVVGGGVVAFYLGFDVSASGEVELKVESERTYDIGLRYANGTLYNVDSNSQTERKLTASINTDVKANATTGLYSEADFFLSGIRFLNAGVGLKARADANFKGRVGYDYC